MGILKWLLRCTPGLSVFGLLILVELALKIVETKWLGMFHPSFLRRVANPVVAQSIFISYSVLIHILALLFPLRLCAAAHAATCEIKATHGRLKKSPSSTLHHDNVVNKLEELNFEQDAFKSMGPVTMTVVMPSYKENSEILESSLRVLASHKLARSSYDVGELRVNSLFAIG